MTPAPHILRALLSHWLRNPLQLATLLIGLALATALWSGVQAINAEARASYGAASEQLAQGQMDQIIAADGRALTIADFAALRRAGWLVTPQIEHRTSLDGTEVRILGVEPLTAPSGMQGLDLAERPLDRALSSALVSPDAAPVIEALRISIDIDPGLGAGLAIMDIGLAARLFDRGTQIDRIFVLREQPLGRKELAEVAPHLRLHSPSQSGGDVARLTDSFHLNLTAFGLLSFAVGLFIVYGAIGLAFEQRRAMFRTLWALGVSLRQLIAVLICEVLLLALLAGGAGVVLGYVIAAALLPDVAATLRGLYGAEVSGALQIRASWWLSGLGMAMGGALIASAGALLRLWRLPIMAAATPQAWLGAARPVMRALFFLGGALLLLALGLGFTAGSLVQGFVLLGCLLIGAAFMLPMALDGCLAALERRASAALPIWFWADTRSQVPGLSMALMALLLAVATNVGVSTMVSSFRLTFTGWLDQRLAAELYVTTSSQAQAEALQGALQDRVDAILPIVSAEITLAGQTGEVFAVIDHATYRDHWPLLAQSEDTWDLVQRPGHALINEQLALREGLGLGDQVPTEQRFTVVGIYSDYGNPAPQMIIGFAPFTALYPDLRPTRFGLRLPESEVPDVMAALAALGVPEENMANQAQIKALSLGIFEQTFTVTAALNVLTLLVAGFSIMMSLLTLSQMRLPQLAPVWALGITRAQLGRMELMRSLALAALVTLLALPLGLALAWVLLAVVNVAAFGWRLPMFTFPLLYAGLAGVTLLAALVAAGWPALRLARTAPHHLLAVFSSNR